MKSLDPVYSRLGSAQDEAGDKDLDLKGDSPQPGVQPNCLAGSASSRHFLTSFFLSTDQSSASWEGSFPLTDEKEEEELDEEEDDEDEEERNKSREEALPAPSTSSSSSVSPSVGASSAPPPRPSPPPDLPVCAKNISLTASGEKVILWTRYTSSLLLPPPAEGAAGVT